ncbi:MAG: DUF2017 family protein [Actinomycetia bacterium]|nr:DUF2017 family protein [Actinomycetes bacterium]MCP4084427.1 DUF2017 family protein [Actinomycetes bacterium]
MFRREKWHFVQPRADGRFDVLMADGAKAVLRSLTPTLRSLVTSEEDAVRRLFPTAYPDDPQRDAGYQVFARQELIEKRLANLEALEETLDDETIDEETLAFWMGTLNDLRLVLGTALDVTEDEDPVIDPSEPDDVPKAIYHVLGVMLEEVVVALTTALPEPDPDANPPG